MLIGNGETAKIWQDHWVQQNPAREARVMRCDIADSRRGVHKDMRVCELLQNQGREWNREKVERIVPPQERHLIERVQIGGPKSKDVYVWNYTKTCHYSVKSKYWVQCNEVGKRREPTMMNQPSFDFLYQLAWKSKASPKVHHFLWKCISNSLHVAENMKKKHMARDGQCLRCAHGTEKINHVLFQCPLARLVWALSSIPTPPGGILDNSLYSNLFHVLNLEKEYPKEDVQADTGPWILWRLWKNRNEFIF